MTSLNFMFLTQHDHRPIALSVGAISAVLPNGKGACVHTTGRTAFEVRESYEEIKALLVRCVAAATVQL